MTTPPAAPGDGAFEPEYPIRTERLLLRPYALADVDALYAYQRLPEVHRYLYTEPRSRSEVEALVAERAGMRREAHLVQSQFIKGGWTDELIYAILHSEWAARQVAG